MPDRRTEEMCIRDRISTGQMKEGEPLPSVRALAKELRISALTVKKAYDDLEPVSYTHLPVSGSQ